MVQLFLQPNKTPNVSKYIQKYLQAWTVATKNSESK